MTHAEGGGVQEVQVLRAVADDEVSAVVGDAPPFGRVGKILIN